MFFPIVASSDPQWVWFEQIWIYTCTLCQEAFMYMYIWVFLAKGFLRWPFKWPLPIFPFLWSSPLYRGTGSLFEQFWIPLTHRWLVLDLIEIGLLILVKRNFKNVWCTFTLFLLSPLGLGQCPSFKQFGIPSLKGDCVKSVIMTCIYTKIPNSLQCTKWQCFIISGTRTGINKGL
jgi:hypothetical protein